MYFFKIKDYRLWKVETLRLFYEQAWKCTTSYDLALLYQTKNQVESKTHVHY